HSMNMALPVGSLLILLSILIYILGLNPRDGWMYLSYAILLGGIIWSMLKLRDKHRDGAITYGDSFLTGLLTGLYSGIIMGIYTFVFYKFFDPAQLQVLKDMAEEAILMSGTPLTDEQIETAITWSHKFMTPGWLSISEVLNAAFISLLIALVVAIFIKRAPKDMPFESSAE
ncbi:MAG TPA: DUF4199 domain-containing protein, partial [Bacteroidales bacterium]|nr:DUF4199 domain-containing protein [Bacteroidales bacterium]